MKRFVLVSVAAASVAVAAAYIAIASGKSDENSAPVFLTEIPQGYRDFGLIAVSPPKAPVLGRVQIRKLNLVGDEQSALTSMPSTRV